METRIAQLEERVRELTRSLERLEARLAALEGTASPSAVPEAGAAVAPFEPRTAAEPASGGAELLALAGRALLVLGGAYLIRWLTEAGTLAQGVGAAAAFLYAALWVVAAERAAARGRAQEASFHGAAALLIGYPLIYESTARLGLLGAGGAALAVALLTALLLFVAVRRDLLLLAWGAVGAALATTLGLVVQTHAILTLSTLAVALGLGCLVVGNVKEWSALAWLPAIAADLLVWQLTYLSTRPEGPPEAYGELPGATVATIALALAFGYLASVALRTLAGGHDVTLFEALQTAVALAIGLGGVSGLARASTAAATLLAVGTVWVGLGAYAAAFVYVERPLGRVRNFYFYTWLGLGLVLWGSRAVLDAPAAGLAWCVLGLTAALLGGHYRRATLRTHGAIYLWAAALATGLAPAAADAFLAVAGTAWRWLSAASGVALVAAAACYGILNVTEPSAELPRRARLPRLTLAILGLLGSGGVLVTALANLSPGAPAVAAMRTAVLTFSALGLALASRSPRFLELSWLVYPVLGAAGVKLLVEDLRVGKAATLFPVFVLYGLALIVTPRLLRRRPAWPEGTPAESPDESSAAGG